MLPGTSKCQCHTAASFYPIVTAPEPVTNSTPSALVHHVLQPGVLHLQSYSELLKPCSVMQVESTRMRRLRKLTSTVVGMTGEHAVQHAQGQAGPAGPCLQEQEQGADQDVRRLASRAGGAA